MEKGFETPQRRTGLVKGLSKPFSISLTKPQILTLGSITDRPSNNPYNLALIGCALLPSILTD